MSEENRYEQESSGAGSVSPSDMAEALNAIKSSNPELGAALDAANLSAEDLAGAHGAAHGEDENQA